MAKVGWVEKEETKLRRGPPRMRTHSNKHTEAKQTPEGLRSLPRSSFGHAHRAADVSIFFCIPAGEKPLRLPLPPPGGAAFVSLFCVTANGLNDTVAGNTLPAP